MANRSYLYSTNIIPGPEANISERKLIGISEWEYDIPIVFKLLLSGNPQTCSSSIWETPDEIALVGSYASGVKNLEQFLSKVKHPSAQNLIEEALGFLKKPENQNEYFVLECGEIFEMEDAPPLEQNLAVLEQIRNIQPEAERALATVNPPPVGTKPPSLLAKLLGRSSKPQITAGDLMKPIYALGLGNWSNVLYFDFSES